MPQPNTTRLGIPQYEDSEPAAFSNQVNAISKQVDKSSRNQSASVVIV